MHVDFNCRVQCGLSGSGVGLGMRSGRPTASRQVVCMVVYRTWCWLQGVCNVCAQYCQSYNVLVAVLVVCA